MWLEITIFNLVLFFYDFMFEIIEFDIKIYPFYLYDSITTLITSLKTNLIYLKMKEFTRYIGQLSHRPKKLGFM